MSGEGKPVSGTYIAAWEKATPEFASALEIIQFERRDQLEVCDCLEMIADQLPDQVDISLYECTHEKLRHNLPVYHQNEEALFELVRERASESVDVPSMLECIRREHVVHNCYADELYESLNDLRAGRGTQSPAAVGYMLRFCFDSIRRHLAWENMTLIPLAKQILRSNDLAMLLDTVQENRKGISLKIV
ncbi:MAG: hemerythrin domain-containing protein [Rhizobiaceae bacterium]